MTNILKEYSEFVLSVSSEASKDYNTFSSRLVELVEIGNELGINIPLLITAYTGLGSEAGEFQEIVKKILFQGKPLNDENIIHMKKELGDIIFYWIDASLALGIDPNEIIQTNIDKLKARYPNGFEVIKSEVRKIGDI